MDIDTDVRMHRVAVRHRASHPIPSQWPRYISYGNPLYHDSACNIVRFERAALNTSYRFGDIALHRIKALRTFHTWPELDPLHIESYNQLHKSL